MTHRAYAFRWLWDAGTLVANGSDAPIEELDPLAGIRAGVLRDWHPEHAVTLDEALLATCVNPAILIGDGRRRGSSCRATSPISSCSTATRTATSRPRRSSPRWSAGANLNPPPWD